MDPDVVRRQVELVRKRIRRWFYGWRRPILTTTGPTRHMARRPRNSPTTNGNTRRYSLTSRRRVRYYATRPSHLEAFCFAPPRLPVF
jgi:hypothetical protein